MHGIPFTALDATPGRWRWYGALATRSISAIPTRGPMCCARRVPAGEAAGDRAGRSEGALRLVDWSAHFPHLAILARARNRWYAHLLMDRDVTGFVRETFFSSLRLSELAMQELGVSDEEIERAIRVFRQHDEHQLQASHAIYLDEIRLIQSAREAAQELADLLEADRQPETEVAATETKPG